MMKRILVWELVGILFISVMGSLLHFVFEWSGRLLPVALIAAVNESVWEHLKLAFWPSVIFTAFEYPFIRKYSANFLPAKVAGFYIVPIVIVLVFYSYTAIIGRSILAVDISTFVLAVTLGQLASCGIMKLKIFPGTIRNLFFITLGILILAFALFTYFPPLLPLFRDSRNGEYGIPSDEVLK